MNTYITFEQCHLHEVDGVCFDRDTVGVFENMEEEPARELAFKLFGPKWCTTETTMPEMHYFPKGLVAIPTQQI